MKSLSIAARSSEYSAPPPNHKVKLPPRENEVRGNGFTAAELQGLGLREGVRVDLQSWPSGPEYVVVDRLPLRLAAARAALPAPVTVADRTVALMLEDEARGQEQKVYRLDDPVMGPTHNTMVRLLLQARVAD